MKSYTVRRTYVEWPWRYRVLNDMGFTVALTVTQWGAKRLVKKMERGEGARVL